MKLLDSQSNNFLLVHVILQAHQTPAGPAGNAPTATVQMAGRV